MSVGIEKSCINRTHKWLGEVEIVSLLCCRSDHVVPESFGHVLMSNQ